MTLSMNTVATILASLAIALASYFSTQEAALAKQVNINAIKQAATAQSNIDIDARLTRIESKIDVLSTKVQ